MTLNGERLRNVRRYKKMTMDNLSSEMSRKLDISATKSMISQWENNKVTPREDTIEKLSLLLEVPEDYLVGSNKFGFAIMDLRFRTGLSVKEISNKTDHSELYLQFIEQYHFLKQPTDLFIFSKFIDYKDIIKEFTEKYEMSMIPSIDGLKEQLIEASIEHIKSKSKELSRNDFYEFSTNIVNSVHHKVASRFVESNYSDFISHDMTWGEKKLKELMNTMFDITSNNQFINLNDLAQDSIEFRYNNKIVSNEDCHKILGILEIFLNEEK